MDMFILSFGEPLPTHIYTLCNRFFYSHSRSSMTSSYRVRGQPEISMDLGCGGWGSGCFGTVTVSTPFSMLAFISSTFTFSGSRKRRRNFPRDRSMRCHLSFLCSSSLLRSPLICRTLCPSSNSIFTSSFFKPGRSALKMCASGVSFQSI